MLAAGGPPEADAAGEARPCALDAVGGEEAAAAGDAPPPGEGQAGSRRPAGRGARDELAACRVRMSNKAVSSEHVSCYYSTCDCF